MKITLRRLQQNDFIPKRQCIELGKTSWILFYLSERKKQERCRLYLCPRKQRLYGL